MADVQPFFIFPPGWYWYVCEIELSHMGKIRELWIWCARKQIPSTRRLTQLKVILSKRKVKIMNLYNQVQPLTQAPKDEVTKIQET